MEFTSTECGFKDGFGGASNAAGAEDYHYLLFGRQTDDQHPENGGVYFEFDDQRNGAVNGVTRVEIREDVVEFCLKDGRKVIVRCGKTDAQWRAFVSGIRDAFDHEIVQLASSRGS